MSDAWDDGGDAGRASDAALRARYARAIARGAAAAAHPDEATWERAACHELPRADLDRLLDHVARCGRCARVYRALTALEREARAFDPAVPAEAPAPERRPARAWLYVGAPLAAALVIAVLVWDRNPQRPTVIEPPRPAPSVPEPERRVERAPTPPPESRPSVETLARFEPPEYVPPVLRGSRPAASRFRDAMARYAAGDYREAAAGLRAAADLEPGAPHIRFFLGIALLLSGERDAGIAQLRQTIALGDSPYLEEAHFYLAKALIGAGDFAGARRELARTAELAGRLAPVARALAAELDTISPPDPSP